MIDVDWPASPSDADLEELDRFLRSNVGEDDLLLDGVHGLLTALAIGPEPPKPEEWLSEVLHQPFLRADEAARVLTLLAQLNDSIAPELKTGAYEPILGEVESKSTEPIYTASGWCEGFSRGIDLRAGQWESRLGHDSELMALLGPVIALAIDEGVFEADGEFAELSDAEYEECLANVPSTMAAVAEYWRVNPPTVDELKQRPGSISQPPRRRGGRWVH